MPFGTNNVDVTVNANSLLGLNSLLITMPDVETEVFFDDEIKGMMLNVTNLLIWAIETNIVNIRPDLALTYYPSIYNFYWFVARNAKYLNDH